MKKLLGFTAFIGILMLLLPLCALKSEKKVLSTASGVKKENTESNVDTVYKSFKVLCDGEIKEYSVEDYIFGVVAAEMPALYHEEALKAQAVAAYTFACIRAEENSDKDYAITADHTVDQSFITEEKTKEKWGEKADEYTAKIKAAVKATSGQMITYKGSPITAAYHAISTGKTEDCKNVWGSERAYLKPILSEGDKLAANYISEAAFTAEEIREKLKNLTSLEGDEKNYFSSPKCTDSGTVTEIKAGTKNLRGSEIQKALGLRSASFTVEYRDGSFNFTVYGAGHGVGMSQNGANYMAKQGSSYKEILCHYYKGCKVE